eukprot:4170660-Amphidinium_carterae.1
MSKVDSSMPPTVGALNFLNPVKPRFLFSCRRAQGVRCMASKSGALTALAPPSGVAHSVERTWYLPALITV